MSHDKIYKNVKYAVFSHITKIVLQFLSRKVFIHYLGVDYLGVNSLFSSVLSILSMTELGLASAIAFSLYGPIVENDTNKIQAIMCLFKKVYRIIGIVMLGVGVLFIPFIPSLVNTTQHIPQLQLLFFIVLLKTSLTYLMFAYAQTLLIASERKYEVDRITIIFYMITNIAEIIILYFTRNYIAYLIIEMVCLIAQQYFIYCKTKKIYPIAMKNKKNVELTKNEKRAIWKNVYGLSINKFAGALLSSIDNIILSTFISTTIVGIYANYTMIQAAATGIISMAFTSVTANVGRKFADNTIKEKHFYFMFYLNYLVCGFCAICFNCLINDFIIIVFGKNYVLSDFTVIALTLNMIVSYMSLATQVFKEASGIFWYGKYRPLITCALNIIFSIILVKPLGITGVIFATILSRLCTTVWYDPYIVFKIKFNKGVCQYSIKYCLYCFIIVFSTICINYLLNLIFISKLTIVIFVLKTLFSVFLAIVFLILLSWWNECFLELKNILWRRKYE